MLCLLASKTASEDAVFWFYGFCPNHIYSRKIHRTYTGVLKVSIILWEEEIAGGKVVHF